MDCRKFRKELSAFIITDPAVSVPNDTTDHLHRCQEYSVEYTRQYEFLKLLHNCEPPGISESEWDRVHSGILAAI